MIERKGKERKGKERKGKNVNKIQKFVKNQIFIFSNGWTYAKNAS
jgi:hypothetical protein